MNIIKFNNIIHLTKDKQGEIKMELLKNIFFNTDKLTQNSTVKISYTGKFFQDQSEEDYYGKI